MAEHEEHPIISKLKEDRGYDPDASHEYVFQQEALLFALQPPQARTNAIRDLNEQIFNPRDRHTGEFLEDRSSLRQKSQAMRLERYYRNAHERLKAAGR